VIHLLDSRTNSLLPDEKESEEDRFEVLGHFVGNVEVHASWGFGFEEASTTGDSTMGFDNDSLCVTVYELKGVSDSANDSEGAESVYIRRVWFRFPWLSTCTGHC
jgi:hypothetical protein